MLSSELFIVPEWDEWSSTFVFPLLREQKTEESSLSRTFCRERLNPRAVRVCFTITPVNCSNRQQQTLASQHQLMLFYSLHCRTGNSHYLFRAQQMWTRIIIVMPLAGKLKFLPLNLSLVDKWIKQHKLDFLGIPSCVGFGHHADSYRCDNGVWILMS